MAELSEEIKKSVLAILNKAKEDIANNMSSNDINASGRTSDSMVVEEYDGGIRLVSRGEKIAPFGTLEVGRKGGKVPKGFSAILYQWSLDKGLDFQSDSMRKTFSYLLARRIAREGTLRHKSPQNNIYSQVVKAVINDVNSKVTTKVLKHIKLHLNE